MNFQDLISEDTTGWELNAIPHTYKLKKRLFQKDNSSLIVFSAEDERRKEWALKIFKRTDLDEDQENFIMDDHWNIGKINSPYVIQARQGLKLHDCLVLPYEFASMDLTSFLCEQERRPNLDDCEKLIRSLIFGLYAIHGKGVAHCDISPNNIFLVDGELKFGDFGFFTLGTVNYRHPNLIEMDRECSCLKDRESLRKYLKSSYLKNDPIKRQKWDVYSLGCVLYDMICHEIVPNGRIVTRQGFKTFQTDKFVDRVGLNAEDISRLENLLGKMKGGNESMRKKIVETIRKCMDVKLDIRRERTRKFFGF